MAGMFSNMNVQEASAEEVARLAQAEQQDNAVRQAQIEKEAKWALYKKHAAQEDLDFLDQQNATIDTWEKTLREARPSAMDKWIEEQQKYVDEFEAERARIEKAYNDQLEQDKQNQQSFDETASEPVTEDELKGESGNKSKGKKKSQPDEQMSAADYAESVKRRQIAENESINKLNQLYEAGIITDKQRVAGVGLVMLKGYLDSENELMKRLTDPMSYEKMSAMQTMEGRKLARRMNRLKKDRIDLVSDIYRQNEKLDKDITESVMSLQKEAEKDGLDKLKEKGSTKESKSEKLGRSVKRGVFVAGIAGLAAKAGSIREKLEERFHKNKTEEVTNERTFDAVTKTASIEKPFEKISDKAKEFLNTVKTKVNNVIDKFKNKEDVEKVDIADDVVITEPDAEDVVEDLTNGIDVPEVPMDEGVGFFDPDIENPAYYEDIEDYTADDSFEKPQAEETVADKSEDETEAPEKPLDKDVQTYSSFVNPADDRKKVEEKITAAKEEEIQENKTEEIKEEQKQEDKKEAEMAQVEENVQKVEYMQQKARQVESDLKDINRSMEAGEITGEEAIEKMKEVRSTAETERSETIQEIKQDIEDGPENVNMKQKDDAKVVTDNEVESNIKKAGKEIDQEARRLGEEKRQRDLEEEKAEIEKHKSAFDKLTEKVKDDQQDEPSEEDRQVGE